MKDEDEKEILMGEDLHFGALAEPQSHQSLRF